VLRLHRAERSDVLADALAQLLRQPLADPFTPEVVAVPAKGVERWLSQRLSIVLGATGRDGVAGNLRFPSPTRLVEQVLAAAGGTGSDPDDDAWAPQRVLWALLDTIDGCVGEPWCTVLSAHLGLDPDGQPDDHRTGRRYATTEHLSELFRSYGAHRPDLLVDWSRGENTDGAGGPLDPDLLWQAELWRRLRTNLDAPSPAERLSDTCRLLIDEPGRSDLPERFSLFGATRLTTEQRAVLAALAEHRDVHLWLPYPSPVMWATVQDAPLSRRRREDRTALDVRHPLLASLARDTRELQQVLDSSHSLHHPGPIAAATLLGSLQSAIRDDVPPTRTASADGTVQVHACHGPPRQVEVLREALLHRFAQDHTLEPRDVLVMCPDVETYAPLVRAAFGQPGIAATDSHPGQTLRVRLADRSLRQTNPLLDTLSGLLTLADGRVSASQVLDLAASAPVRRRFGFDDDELERLRDWAGRAGVRWGLGAQQREAYALHEVPQNTWDTGLNRILLGVAADETSLEWLGLALPLDDVNSSDIDLAGRLAELLERLDTVLGRLRGAQPVRDWIDCLRDALELLTEVSDDDSWQLTQALRQLAEAAERGADAVLRLADLRVLLAGRLAGRPTRANFRTGELTVCTMVPMRSVPHRVIALLGLDDGVFPRGGVVDGDDVLARDPCLGERDVRSEDRQLLLDAVMSAQDCLLLLYTGADPVTGAIRPPAVPLGELLDVIGDTVGPDELASVVTRHPLQPFDRRNFLTDRPFSFDTGALAGARAALHPRRAARPLLTGPLPSRAGDVALAELIAFVIHPTKAFLSRRLGIFVSDREESVADALHVELDALQKWSVGDRMLAARLAGVDPTAFRQAELRRGTLPPGPLGLRLLDELAGAVEPLAAAGSSLQVGMVRLLDIDVDLGGDRRLTGTVHGSYGSVLASASYSTLAPKHRLAAWTRLLAAAATGAAAAPTTAVTIGRGPHRKPVWRSVLTAPTAPLEVLRELVALYDEGMREPLPLATGASCEYAARRQLGSTGDEAMEAATKEWDSRFGDGTDRHLAYVLGTSPRLSLLTGTAATSGDDPTRFGALARRLWSPLLAHETVGAP
jgi:exodeoxyribonuclease V gamma subunit